VAAYFCAPKNNAVNHTVLAALPHSEPAGLLAAATKLPPIKDPAKPAHILKFLY
jgi:hypothetical protein